MAKMAIDFQRTASTAASLGSVVADGTRPRRFRVYDLILGSEATPADAAILWTLNRVTGAGTATDVVEAPLDQASAATELDSGENHTIEPTHTANTNMLNIPLNQRATFRWVAAPGGEIIVPATANNGVAIQTDTISTGTPVITAQMHIDEE